MKEDVMTSNFVFFPSHKFFIAILTINKKLEKKKKKKKKKKKNKKKKRRRKKRHICTTVHV